MSQHYFNLQILNLLLITWTSLLSLLSIAEISFENCIFLQLEYFQIEYMLWFLWNPNHPNFYIRRLFVYIDMHHIFSEFSYCAHFICIETTHTIETRLTYMSNMSLFKFPFPENLKHTFLLVLSPFDQKHLNANNTSLIH